VPRAMASVHMERFYPAAAGAARKGDGPGRVDRARP
jgi:hypothetical protein